MEPQRCQMQITDAGLQNGAEFRQSQCFTLSMVKQVGCTQNLFKAFLQYIKRLLTEREVCTVKYRADVF